MFNIRSIAGELRVVLEDANVTRILRRATPTDVRNLADANTALSSMQKRGLSRKVANHD
jgi:hypothetical protein